MTKGPDADRLYLVHVLECIENVNQDVRGDRDRLVSDRTTRDAVLRNLQVLAESTQRLSDEIKSTQPHVPWQQIAGFRHRLVHDYFRIDVELVWRIVDQHLPELQAAAKAMMAALP